MSTTADRRRGADAVATVLADAGIERIFSLSGNQIMVLYDACLDVGIDIVHVRHEAAAVHMADAWGRLTGRPGVALLTAGPGHGNAVSALYGALACQSPMLMLSGHAPVAGAGRGAFQEFDQAAMARPVCKAAWTPQDADALVLGVASALDLSVSGTPGPVQFNLPSDLLEGTASDARPAQAGASMADPAPAPAEVARAADAIAAAQRVLLVAGPGAMRGGTWQVLQELAEAASCALIGAESPRGLRDPALGLFGEVLAQADLVVLVDKPLDYTLGFGAAGPFNADGRILDVQPDASMAARNRRAAGERYALRLNCSGAAGATALRDALAGRECRAEPGWAAAVREAVDFRPAQWPAQAARPSAPVHPLALFGAVQAEMDRYPSWTLVCDGGEVGQWAQALLRPTTRLLNGPSGSIGSGLPMAVAARLLRPAEPVVAVMGDGTAGFHLAEFDTAVRAGADLVAIIGNDARWNAEYQIQLNRFGANRMIGCELQPTRYDEVVRPFGVHGAHVARSEELGPALREALAAGRPACIDVALDGQPAPTFSRS